MTPLATQVIRKRISVIEMDSSREDVRNYGGTLDFNSYGIAGCVLCGWRGVPSYVPVEGKFPEEIGGVERSVECPACYGQPGASYDVYGPDIEQADIEYTLRFGKVGRNDPCPCGSGRKAKKCHPETTT